MKRNKCSRAYVHLILLCLLFLYPLLKRYFPAFTEHIPPSPPPHVQFRNEASNKLLFSLHAHISGEGQTGLGLRQCICLSGPPIYICIRGPLTVYVHKVHLCIPTLSQINILEMYITYAETAGTLVTKHCTNFFNIDLILFMYSRITITVIEVSSFRIL